MENSLRDFLKALDSLILDLEENGSPDTANRVRDLYYHVANEVNSGIVQLEVSKEWNKHV